MLESGECPKELSEMYLGHVHWDQKIRHGQSKRHYSILIGNKDLFKTVSKEATFYFADGTFSTAPRQARNVNVRGAQVNLFCHESIELARDCLT